MLEAVLRIVHILFAVFVAGYYFLMVPILMPALKKLGPSVQGPLIPEVASRVTPVMWTSQFAIVATGIASTLILRGSNLSSLFITGWGWAMIIGLALTAAWVLAGFTIMDPTLRRIQSLGRSIQGRAPTAEEARQLGQLGQKATTLLRLSLALVSITLLDMLVARYL